jgi:hypothetical protein
MTFKLGWQHCRQFDMNCQSDSSQFNTKYESIVSKAGGIL